MTHKLLSIGADEIHVWMAATRPDPDSERLLSEDERRRANQFKSDAPRRIFISSRARLRRVLSQYLPLPPADISFVYGPHGKPALAMDDNQSNLRFNLSHADDMCVVAVARGIEVGIDIERVRLMPDMKGIAGRFFQADDLARWLAASPDRQPETFFQIWTQMESRCKAIGQGIGLLDHKPAAIVLANCSAWPIWLRAGYVGAVATVAGRDVTIKQLDWSS